MLYYFLKMEYGHRTIHNFKMWKNLMGHILLKEMRFWTCDQVLVWRATMALLFLQYFLWIILLTSGVKNNLSESITTPPWVGGQQWGMVLTRMSFMDHAVRKLTSSKMLVSILVEQWHLLFQAARRQLLDLGLYALISWDPQICSQTICKMVLRLWFTLSEWVFLPG